MGVSSLRWVPGTQLRSPGRAANALHYLTVFSFSSTVLNESCIYTVCFASIYLIAYSVTSLILHMLILKTEYWNIFFPLPSTPERTGSKSQRVRVELCLHLDSGFLPVMCVHYAVCLYLPPYITHSSPGRWG